MQTISLGLVQMLCEGQSYDTVLYKIVASGNVQDVCSGHTYSPQ